MMQRKKEVLVIKNIPITDITVNWKVYDTSRLTAYSVEGMNLVPVWKSRDLLYCLTDMKETDGTLFVGGHKGKLSNLGAESGLVMWFE